MLERLHAKLIKRLNNATAELARLEAKPPEFDALFLKGNELLQKGLYSTAESTYREALTLRPNDIKSSVNLAFALKEQKRLAEARVYLRKALSGNPDDPLAHETNYLLGLVLEEDGMPAEAIVYYEKALALSPSFVHARLELCRILSTSNQHEQAQEVLQKGLLLSPDNANFHFYQGNLHVLKSQNELAVQSYSRALALGADGVELYAALGLAQYRIGSKTNAIENLKIAEALEAGSVINTRYGTGHHCLQTGDIANAIENFELVIALRPDYLMAHSMLLFCLSFSPSKPYAYREAAQRFDNLLRLRTEGFLPPIRQSYVRGQRPLKVGFVSGDFKAHPVGFFLEGILRELDSSRIQPSAYSYTSKEDQLTVRLRAQISSWYDIRNSEDMEVANMICDHGIDILVDLTGHSGINRLQIFAFHAAPVQVAWLGYFASTGVTEMDFLLADPISVPANTSEYFCENIWYLPDTRLCMTPPSTSYNIPVSPPPVLKNGFITFGSFQALTKIGNDVLAVWSCVLTATPTARLRLQIPQVDVPSIREGLLARLVQAGIDLGRVDLSGGVHWEAYLESYHKVDILLDTFPYTGGTTTAEALWMGVPTIALRGNTMLSRQGEALLTCVGLTEWIANDEAEYVSKAIHFADDQSGLVHLRNTLRERALQSPLFDTRRFAQNLQNCLEEMFVSQDAASLVTPKA